MQIVNKAVHTASENPRGSPINCRDPTHRKRFAELGKYRGFFTSGHMNPLSNADGSEYIDRRNTPIPVTSFVMNRRDTMKRLMAASGALVALPAWADGWSASDLMHHQGSFTSDAQDTLAAVADTIIPAGDSIGALSVGADKFLQKLIDNCYEKEVQDNVKVQLAALDTSSQSLHGKTFRDCDQLQREQILLARAASGNKAEEEFFALMKSETIRGFNTSREVMVNYLHFKQVPGHYYGCVDVNA